LKFPAKQGGVLSFLSGILRDEGGYDFKKAVVEAIFDLIRFVPEAKEDSLATLCEFVRCTKFVATMRQPATNRLNRLKTASSQNWP